MANELQPNIPPPRPQTRLVHHEDQAVAQRFSEQDEARRRLQAAENAQLAAQRQREHEVLRLRQAAADCDARHERNSARRFKGLLRPGLLLSMGACLVLGYGLVKYAKRRFRWA